MRLLGIAAAVGAAAAGGLSMPAGAGLFDDEEARNRIEATEGRVTELASAPTRSTATRSISPTRSRRSRPTSPSCAARSKSWPTYELEATQKRQKDFYVDLDNRLRKLETPPAGSQTGNAEARSRAGNPRLRSRAGQPQGREVQGGRRRLPRLHQGLPEQQPGRLGPLLGRLRPRPGQGPRRRRGTVRQVRRRLAQGRTRTGALESRVASLEASRTRRRHGPPWNSWPRNTPTATPARRPSSRLKKK
jgi:hypothetical protein